MIRTATLLEDLHYSARMLARSPAFTIVAILTLSLGIGANTAIFSVANALLFQPLPYEDPSRLVIVTSARGPNRRPFSYNRAQFLASHGSSFAGFAPFVTENFNLTGGGDPELLPSARVAWNFFDVLGVHPLLGRAFQREEDQPGGRPVVLISDSLWKRRFGADPGVIGQSLTLDSTPASIIGVMPPDFEFAPLGRSIDLWSTRTYETNSVTRQQVGAGATYLIAVARIRPGLPLDQAQAEMRVLDARYRSENPGLADADPRQNISLNQVQDLMVAPVRRAVLVLFGAVALVLLIACANVASLLLSRAFARRKEIAIRTALGATRTGLIRQLLTESIFLALVSGGIGIALSAWSVRIMASLPPDTLPRINPVRIDTRVLLFSLAASFLTGILFGLIPALQMSKTDVQGVLRDEGRGVAGGRLRQLTRSLLVVSQIAISMMLLIGAGLLMRSFVRLEQVPLGFNPDRLLLMNIALAPSRYSGAVQVNGFFARAIHEVASLPGVRSAAVSSALPLQPSRYASLLPEGQPYVAPAQRPLISIQSISPSFFETMGIPLLRGRAFSDRDTDGAPLVAIVNEVFARRYWPNEDAVGKHVVFGNLPKPIQIVGVTGNVKNVTLAVITTPEMYFPLAQRPSQSLNLVVRSSADPRALSTPVRSRILAIDQDQPVTNVRTMEQHLSGSIRQTRLTMLLLAVFSTVALLVATVGLYGLIGYSVAQRTQELGIRLALGAGPGQVLRLVLRQGLVLAILGVLLGLAGSLALTRGIQSLLYDVSPTDGWTFAACALAFIAIALAASYIPARRAARIDPIEALRCE
ncbi:MAG: ABC transporter permease [Acidobacteriia bacterium]|nr:ABC transporter permease [Terriglobia bacterium]